MSTSWSKHPEAWRVPSETNDKEYGVLVRQNGYWWLLCPAAATLYVNDDDTLLDCNIGMECDWDDVHEAADKLRQDILAVDPVTEPEGDSVDD